MKHQLIFIKKDECREQADMVKYCMATGVGARNTTRGTQCQEMVLCKNVTSSLNNLSRCLGFRQFPLLSVSDIQLERSFYKNTFLIKTNGSLLFI